MTRRLPQGIIHALCDYTEEIEIPTEFSMWAAISAISATLGRDCFIDRGFFTVYPNLYIVLVAGSAVCKKSSAISLTNGLVQKVDPPVRMLSQKMTPEALIGSLSGMSNEDNTIMLDQAAGILVADELATLIDKNAFASGMITILTKLYDCTDFNYETKGRGLELIKNPCLSIMGGMTMHGVRDAIPKEAIGAGFTSRVLFIYKQTADKLVPRPELYMNDDCKKLFENIIHDINLVGRMRGRFGVSNGAWKIFEKEYVYFRTKCPMLSNPNFDGYIGRRDVNLLKVAMACSASRKDDRVIDDDDMTMAIKALKLAELYMPKVLQAISTEFVGDVCEQVLSIIMHSGGISRSKLITGMKHRLTVRQLDVIIETLEQEGVIKSAREGTTVNYLFIGGS